jgi:arginine-tRNA-protein transferase
LGTANVLWLVADARAGGRPHLYLGFRVSGCESLRYKASFKPHELLLGRPAMNEAAVWKESP